MTKSDLVEYNIYKNPMDIIGNLISEQITKVYMEVPLKNGLKRDLVFEATNMIIGEIVLDNDPIEKHIEYLEKDMKIFNEKYVKYLIITNYPLNGQIKFNFSRVLDENNIDLYNIVIGKNGESNLNWKIEKGNDMQRKLKFNELVNQYNKNVELYLLIEYIKMKCDFKNFHNFSFFNHRSERFGSTINNLEFWINTDIVELKYNNIIRFIKNKDLMNNIINSAGGWRFNKKNNGIFIPTDNLDLCCDILNNTIKLLKLL